MPLLFAVTLFVSASLLFMVQPMVGKMILPLLGGSPAVWNACMVFFQALLLLGYLYAHLVSTRLPARRQWLVHLLVLGGPIAAMGLSVVLGAQHTPIAVADGLAPTDGANPFLAVMALMTVAIGVPFFVSATSAPLLQKWFGFTGHPAARDPYFLYAASNAGSLISLLGYPLFIEPNMILAGQAWLWAGGFVVLVFLILACGRAAANPVGVPPPAAHLPRAKPGRPSDNGPPAPPAAGYPEPPPTPGRIAKWVALAFVPSSWMLGVTFHMTTDIASVPLLWVVPLALYLVTFIIAFSTVVPDWFRLVIGNFAPVMILLLVFVMLSHVVDDQVGLTLLLHICTFFAAALMCHYELARDRPGPAHLTGYFLWMSVGGVLGGLFNALVAPVLLPVGSTAPLAVEYPITIVVACLLVPRLSGPRPRLDSASELERFKAKLGIGLTVVLPLLLAGLFFLLFTWLIERESYHKLLRWLTATLDLKVGGLRLRADATTWDKLIRFAVPVMACFFFVDRPLRFGLGVAALLLVHYGVAYSRADDDGPVYTERGFFGILKIEQDGRQRKLVHGTTLHGTQITNRYLVPLDVPQGIGVWGGWEALLVNGAMHAYDPRQEPLTYYHRTGPVGAMFHELRTRKGGADAKADVAMVGLGTGSVSCYALPGQHLTFYEIDPAVRRLVADDRTFFTYVKDAEDRGATVTFQMGDARLKLKDDEDRKYALLLVDAFSSDSIPVHLLTKQAVELYMNRLTPDGILALHISNKYIRLEPVVSRIAAELGLEARVWNDDAEGRPGKTASSWVVLARSADHLGQMAAPTPVQVDEFVGGRHPLTELHRKYGGGTLFTAALDAEAGRPVAPAIDLLRRYVSAESVKRIVGKETPAGLAEVERLRDKYGAGVKVKEAVAKEGAAPPLEAAALLVTKPDLTLGAAADELLAARPELALLREWVRKYAPAEPEPAADAKPDPDGLTLGKALRYQFGPDFLAHARTAVALENAADPPDRTLDRAVVSQYGRLYHRLRLADDFPLWTDDYSDVMRVMMIKEVQAVRRWFGLPVSE